MGYKRVFVMAIQAPFAIPTRNRLEEILKANGSELVGGLIYEKEKTTYRSEVDQALRAKPDLIYLNGYAPDTIVTLRDLYRAGFNGPRFAQSYAVPAKTLETLPPEVTENIYTGQPSADVGSKPFELAAKRLGIAEPDSYECQATDWISIVALTIAKAKEATGQALRDNVRKITQGNGQKVSTAVEGLKAAGRGQGDQLRGRQRSVRLHRHRRHLRLQVPLRQSRRRQVQVPQDRLTRNRRRSPCTSCNSSSTGSWRGPSSPCPPSA